MWQSLDIPKNSKDPTPRPATNSSSPAAQLHTTDEQTTIGPSFVIKGEVSGSEPLYIDGQVEGTITIMENRLTIGRNGSVTANITAKELVVMGKLSGNVNVTERVAIRGEGSLTGDVVAQRLSIEDGAFFKGSVELKKSEKPYIEAKRAKVEPAQMSDKPMAMTRTAGKA